MGIQIEVSLENSDFTKFAKKLNRITENFSNRMKFNTHVGVKALKEIDKQFRSDGQNFNTPWSELSQATIDSRRRGKKPGSARILRDSGLLRNSFTFKATRKSVIVGTATEYARLHEEGGRVKFGNRQVTVPQRKMLPGKKVGYAKILNPVAKDYVKNIVNRNG